MEKQIPNEKVAGVLALLDEVDRLRDERRYEQAFWTAQEAMEAMPADGSMDPAEFEELQLVAWLKRDHCQDRWNEQLHHRRRPERQSSGPTSTGAAVPASCKPAPFRSLLGRVRRCLGRKAGPTELR